MEGQVSRRAPANRMAAYYILLPTLMALSSNPVLAQHNQASSRQAGNSMHTRQVVAVPGTSSAGLLEPVIPPQLSSREVEKAIVDRILGEGYDKRIRPAGSGSHNASRLGSEGPTIVKVNTLVRSISKIDDVTMEYSVQLTLRQEWTDDRLAYGTMHQYKDYGLNSITLTEQERIWKPDLFFRNEKEGHFHKIIMPNVLLRIKSEGEVLYSIRISLVLACPMDLKYYPLDKQNCTIEMASYGYLEEELKFLWKEENPVQIAQPLNLPRFALETHHPAYCTSRTTTGAYSCLRIDLKFKREFSYYLIQIYIPCCMLVIVSWVSFWLDPNAIPARVSLGVTTLLTMATQISGINASLPPVSYIKAIDVWTGVCLTFVFGALLEFALVNYASRSDQHKREMLASALTQTQQMRWREATAAAVAAGTAPPTAPPYDENSPSILTAGLKQQPVFFGANFGATIPQAPASGMQIGTTLARGRQNSKQPFSDPANGGGGGGNSIRKPNGVPAGNSNQIRAQTVETSNFGARARRGIAMLSAKGSFKANATNNKNSNRTNYLIQASSNAAGLDNCQQQQQQQHSRQGSTKLASSPYLNYNAQYLNSLSRQDGKRRNWCKMWLAKFPTRSKRIDVISRIFFPLKFALFNLVYWTTYLFREEDKTL